MNFHYCDVDLSYINDSENVFKSGVAKNEEEESLDILNALCI